MTRMTTEEKQAFLSDVHVGVLALNEPGKGPLAVPVWYDYTPGGDLWFLTGTTSRKAALMKVGSRLGLVAQTEAPPYSYVSVEGEVVSLEPVEMAALERMAIRYLGEEQGRAYAAGSDLTQQVLVRVQPSRWLAVDYSKA